MLLHHDVLKAAKVGHFPDLYTALYAKRLRADREYERFVSGQPPITLLDSIGKPLVNWSITGNIVQDGEPSPDNPVEVKGVGEKTENLFDLNTWGELTSLRGTIEKIGNGYKLTATGADLYTPTYGSSVPNCSYPVNPNETYTLSWDVDKTNVFGLVYIFTGKFIAGTVLTNSYASAKKVTFTIPQNHNMIAFRVGVSNAGDSLTYSNIMLNEGSTALPYEPYGYKVPVVSKVDGQEITTPIYLPSPLMADEVLKSDGSREVEWGKLVLTGDEGWLPERYNRYYLSTVIGTDSYLTNDTYCSHLPYNTNVYQDTGTQVGIVSSKSGIRIRMPQTEEFDTTSEFKAWLKSEYDKGTPVTVWYQLAEPTSETVDVPQIPTLKGNCTIDVDTEVKPKNMSIDYLSSVKDTAMSEMISLLNEV